MAASYTLRDLINAASAAERLPVSERAVRHYLADGLLPPARGQGLAATFSDDHLASLRLVVRLAGQYVPLGEIQRWIVTLSPEQIRALLERPAVPRLPVEGDAQAYLMRLQKSVPSKAVATPRLSQPMPVKRAGLRQMLRPPSAHTAAQEPEPDVGVWMHMAVSSDVVLLLREGVYDAKVTGRLVQALKRALMETDQPTLTRPELP